MNRAFTTREKVLLVILAVLIIGIGYPAGAHQYKH